MSNTPEAFIQRWKDSAGAELANSQLFLTELCDLLDVPHPDGTVADNDLNVYTFEKTVEFNNGDGTTSYGRVDLYRKACFVLESKQGTERKAVEQAEALATVTKQKKLKTGTAQRGTAHWHEAMTKARKQAEGYAKALPEWPPFLIVADVGHCFDLYADFSGTGKLYQPFPDPKNFRIPLADLAQAEVREKFRAIWLDPHSLDVSKQTAKVTRELASRLAKLAKSLEEQTDDQGKKRYPPEDVAHFLMRCLFTMFAEDVNLIPLRSFTQLLESLREQPEGFAHVVEALWKDMDSGSPFSPILRTQIKQFNGGLFESQQALPLNRDQLELLIEAAHAQWQDVEPAIFGTLLERALDPHERHKLGAHYTPRAYVERLVMPTIMEPLREQWDETYAAAAQLRTEGKSKEAIEQIRDFHEQLCETRVLDPACGSGNFLYVALELMKRLEGEVLNALREFGDSQLPLLTIDPHQFLGIEVNPRAAAITDLVLWIGYLQWHFRTRPDDHLNEPIIRKFHNIECRDAVLAWDRVEPVTDGDGNPVTRWDGRTTKPHPVTGEEVPDETARVQELRYVNPRKAEWPEAEYVVGNPPFIGPAMMRSALGSGYTEAIRRTHKELPESCDFVMYWWHNAAELTRHEKVRRFGFIATNSLRQTFNRRVVAPHLEASNPLSIAFAIPDHPWVDSADGAAVRISMTVGIPGVSPGRLWRVLEEKDIGQLEKDVQFKSDEGPIWSNLHIGVDIASVRGLSGNSNLSNRGVCLFGSGFIVTSEQARKLGLNSDPKFEKWIREYRNGRDLTQRPRDVMVIDLYPLALEQVKVELPEVFQWIVNHVKPERDQNRDKAIRENWWLHGRPRPELREALRGLTRYIVTPETTKHRLFSFLDHSTSPDNALVVIASEDALTLGLLSSWIHVVWALAVGGRLGVGNDPRYNKTRCFETFPFPLPTEDQKQRIRTLAEQLDAHRKRQQELHSDLTMTGMYNVLEKLRSGETLTAKEQKIHEQGLVSVLKQIHDDLDAAVFEAYGWPADLSDEEILERLVALNHERAEEEARGIVRWLRPEFQNPGGTSQTQLAAETATEAKPKKAAQAAKTKKEPWPKKLPEQMRVLRRALHDQSSPCLAEDLAKGFTRAPKKLVGELLETLVEVGQARVTDDGRFAV
ncbi:hypothetical protein Pan97_31230 [Bremerella volcania]|uniref:site-specific DNA-methyltransferase (adenine-specific) n=1 Tax=Bremerella volcania TaxID=2527984 RepID=A0A518CA22_9BACT|nr:DNA methyltransferase [Bremerella volcania]QDU76078.1 hypothetical protein Pan97_31230 [Bremerella volcania]